MELIKATQDERNNYEVSSNYRRNDRRIDGHVLIDGKRCLIEHDSDLSTYYAYTPGYEGVFLPANSYELKAASLSDLLEQLSKSTLALKVALL